MTSLQFIFQDVNLATPVYAQCVAATEAIRYISAMSKSEILDQLSKLTPDERQELRLRLAELDGDDWLDKGVLTEAEKALIEQRVRTSDAAPESSIPWSEAKARLLAPFKR